MGFFDEEKEVKRSTGEKEKGLSTSSNLGREITSVKNATKELHFRSDRVDPVPFIDDAVLKDKTFYGQIHGGINDSKPFFLNDEDTTMEIYVGSTGTGKGVYLGNKTLEAIRRGKGVIIIDPKKDDFLPQIVKEEMDRQGRPDDFQVCSWANNFGYMGINEFDTYKEVANKFIDALDLTPTDNQGVDYYRKNGRVMLNKVLKLFFNGTLGVVVKKDFIDILLHLRMLKEDLEKQVLLEKEMGKIRRSENLIEKYEERYYKFEKVEKIYWDTTTIETLDSLVKSVSEIAEGADIFNEYTLEGALYEGKVLYLRVDMLDVASLKMVKMMITDAIQQARRKTANTVIIADELSFYANDTIAGALATVRSMGLKFLLALQDLSQMKDENIRNAILSNCNVKMFYKISDKNTLEYVEKIGGKEAVTAFSLSGDGDTKISQQTEDVMNATRIRAMPRQFTGIIIAEALPKTVLVRTNYVKISKKFDWKPHETRKKSDNHFKNIKMMEEESDDTKLANYRMIMSESALENSDLFGIAYASDKIYDTDLILGKRKR